MFRSSGTGWRMMGEVVLVEELFAEFDLAVPLGHRAPPYRFYSAAALGVVGSVLGSG